MERVLPGGRRVKVGDLVKFHNPDWDGPVPIHYWGCGLVERENRDGTFSVYWSKLGQTRVLGPKALEVISESR